MRKMPVELRNDFAIDAMTQEVERRKKDKPCCRYSYGKLVADTTREEREGIAERYAIRAGADQEKLERFQEPDDARIIEKVTDAVENK